MSQKQLSKSSAFTAPTAKFEHRQPLADGRSRKPNGYWEDFNNLAAELKPLLIEYGPDTALNQRWLNANGHCDLAIAINRKHAGLPSVRDKLMTLGLIEKAARVRQPKGHWQNFDNLVLILQPLIDLHGPATVLSRNWLISHRHSSISNAIIHHHGGFSAIGAKLHELGLIDQTIQHARPPNHWKNIDNVVQALKPHLDQWGPGVVLRQSWLDPNGYSSLSSAIHNFHGGFAFRSKLKEMGIIDQAVNPQLPSGHWQNFENVVSALQPLFAEYGPEVVLNKKWLLSHRHSSISNAIFNHGGLIVVRARLQEMGVISSSEKEFANASLQVETALQDILV